MSERPVDRAMDEERHEKATVRSLWLQEVKESTLSFPEDTEPLYLTLSGAGGRDVKLLTDNNIIGLTENESVTEEDRNKIVAIESSPLSVLELQKRFPGLKILEANIQNLVSGTELLNWPTGENRKYCRARVVNLDLDKPLHALDREGHIVFPVINWVTKLAQLHASPPRKNWSLCLTLNGDLPWNEATSKFIHTFLSENFQREPRFAASCRNFLGEGLYEQLEAPKSEVSFHDFSQEMKQKLLAVIVPKLIANSVHTQGWRIHTETNLRYGACNYAPMVTWILRFNWDSETTATPDATYREAISKILCSVGVINEDGQVE